MTNQYNLNLFITPCTHVFTAVWPDKLCHERAPFGLDQLKSSMSGLSAPRGCNGPDEPHLGPPLTTPAHGLRRSI